MTMFRATGLVSDGIVLVSHLRTLRLKDPTVDFIFMDGGMYATDSGALVRVAGGDPEMVKGVVYEMDLIMSTDQSISLPKLIRPRARIFKVKPNPIAVVRRAVVIFAVTADLLLATRQGLYI